MKEKANACLYICYWGSDGRGTGPCFNRVD